MMFEPNGQLMHFHTNGTYQVQKDANVRDLEVYFITDSSDFKGYKLVLLFSSPDHVMLRFDGTGQAQIMDRVHRDSPEE